MWLNHMDKSSGASGRLRTWLRSAWRGLRRVQRDDFAEELGTHVALAAEELQRRGASAADAQRLARARVGSIAAAAEARREARGHAWLDSLRRDLRQAVRIIIRRPRIAATLALTMALGVGANAAILDTFDRLMFRPLDVPRAGELVAVHSINRRTGRYQSATYLDYLDFTRARSLSGLSAYVRMQLPVVVDGSSTRPWIDVVTPSFFDVLGVSPIRGQRWSTAAQPPGWPMVALVSETFWHTRLNADPNAVGRTIAIDDLPVTILGVLPATFAGYNLGWGKNPDLWMPMDAVTTLVPAFARAGVLAQRGRASMVLLGRLAPGATPRDAQSELEVIASAIARDSPSTNHDVSVDVFPAGQAKFWPAYRTTLMRSLTAFAGATALVFILAVTNVMTLLLHQALARERETAVRLALGASRRTIARQLFVEGLVVALPGAAMAIAVAWAVLHSLGLFPRVFGIGASLDLAVGGRLVAICLGLSVGLAGLFALVPWLHFRDWRLWSRLTLDQRSTGTPRHLRLQRVSLALQVGLSSVLLAAAMLVIRSEAAANSTPLGFDVDHLLIVTADLRSRRAEPTDLTRALDGFRSTLAAQAWVDRVSLTSRAPLDHTGSVVTVLDSTSDTTGRQATQQFVDAEFLATTGMPIVSGRGFSTDDMRERRAVVLVNRTTARMLWPDASSSFHTLTIRDAGTAKTFDAIGVVADAHYTDVWDAPGPILYRIDWPVDVLPTVLVRTREPADRTVLGVRESLRMLPETLVPAGVSTGRQQLAEALGPQRMASAFFGILAVLALLVAIVGLQSTTTHTIEQRRREIAVRIAVGGTPTYVSVQVIRPLVILAIGATLAGIGSAAMFTPLLASQAKGISAHDPVTFISVAAVMVSGCVAIAIIAVSRAARTDAAATLRSS
jgi:predicted permease